MTQENTPEQEAKKHSTKNQFDKKKLIFVAIGVAIVFISWSISLLIFTCFTNMSQTFDSSFLVTLFVCYLYIAICMIINKYNFKSGVLISLGIALALPVAVLIPSPHGWTIDFIILFSIVTLSLLLITFITTIVIFIASKIRMRKNKTTNSIVITTTQQKSSDNKKADNKMICAVIGAVAATVLLCYIFVIKPFNITYHLGYVNKTDEAKYLLDAGADINAKIDHDGSTALMLAAGDGRTDIVKLLIDAGADVNARNDRCSTALIEALNPPYRCVWYYEVPDKTPLIQLLINAGADIDAKDSYGKTALSYAERKGHTQIAQLLRDAGATR